MALGGAAAAWPTLVRDLFAGSICGVVSVAIGLSAAIDPMADLTRFGTTLTCALCGGAHALERARLQPPDRGGVHAVGSRHVRLRLASIKPRQGFLPLVWRQLAVGQTSHRVPWRASCRRQCGHGSIPARTQPGRPGQSASGDRADWWCLPRCPSAT